MNRFKLVCIGVVVLIAAMIMCSCAANSETIEHESDYEIIRVGSDKDGVVRIYKVKTPEKTYIIFCSYRGGSVILN